MSKRDELIAQKAHELWEKEGKPHGRHEDHWHQAAAAVEAGNAKAAPEKVKKPRTAKAASDSAPAKRSKTAAPGGADAEKAAPAEKAPRAPRKPRAKATE